MSSTGEVGGCGVTIRLLVLGLAATVLTIAGTFLMCLTVKALVAAIGLAQDF
jgi:hypothetical protein